MPLLGKIVVIKRNGTDGTEFPLTASCLFGRKVDCDIRIQLPQVSKEHCKIELNENKEVKRTHAVVIRLKCMNTKSKRTLNETLKVYGCVVAITTKLILTNLSLVNPTLINGETLQQSERLKHGDLITIIDRSFRFEYPPAQTPKKKHLSTPGKGETVKVLQDQQVKSTPGSTEKKKSEHAKDTCLKDGSNLPACPGQSVGDQSTASTDSTLSPFSDLYNMVKRDLSTKPVWKSASVSNTPLSKQELEKVSSENEKPATPKSAQKKRRSSTARAENLPAQVKTATPVVLGEQKRCSEGVRTPVPQKKTPQTTPQKFTTDQVAQQIAFESPITKSPKARRSGASQTPENWTTTQNPSKPTEAEEAEEAKAKQATRTSPRASAGKRFQVQDVSQEVVAMPTSDDTGNDQKSSKKHKRDDLPLPAAKRKRVSFGGQLSPELFDKRLPPDSPLRRGATPWRRSLGFSQKSHSLLRRASTIGLMGYQLEEDLAESPARSTSPKRAASPAKTLKKTPSPAKTLKKTPSPAKTLKKTPSPAKKPPSPKAKTPSPKNSKTPPPPSNPSTPTSSRRLSNASAKSRFSSEESLLKTPTTHGRFSVSRISTPSPIPDPQKETKEEPVHVEEVPRVRATPRATLRRSSMKASARKSVLKSALDVVRSRRSGASRANLKVVSSWADIVKFGQAKPQMEGDAKKTTTKRTAVKHAKANKPKTPAHRLKDHTSTGHADSPASIVVGKAYLRSTQLVGAAPKVVCNVALFKKDMKMDEDLTGLSDIFKTPANSRRKSAFIKTSECPATPLGVEMTETSVMNTPEESGEMVVSPMSVASSAGPARYNAEAVTRLLQDDQDGSVIEEKDDSAALPPSNVSVALDMSSEGQLKNKKATPVQTPQRKPAQAECLTGVKRLMRTPKQKAEPVEDLRGKLLKTPKDPTPPQEESLEGVKELLDTPVQKGTLLEDNIAGVKKLTKTPKVINSPVVCAVALKRLVKTPKDKTEREEDFTGVKRLMKTPRQKKQQVEEDLTGVQEMMQTPQQKKQPAEEDLTGVLEMMKTPQQKKQPAEEDLTGVLEMMKTPQQKKQPAEEDLTGVQEIIKTPQQKKQPVEEDLTGVQQMMKTPKQKSQLVEDLVGVKRLLQTPKEKGEPVENDFGIDHLMKTPKQKRDEAVLGSTMDAEFNSVSSGVLLLEDASEESEEKENICPVEDVKNDGEAVVGLQIETEEGETSCQEVEASVASPEQEEQSNRSSPDKKTRLGAQVRTARRSQKSQERQVDSDSLSGTVAGSEEETSAGSAKSVPCVRVRRGKSAVDHLEDVPVQTPDRKYTRGKIPKEQAEAQKPVRASAEALKPRRGRKAERDVSPVVDLTASAEVGDSVKTPAPARTKRGRKEKHEPENPRKPEASVEEVGVASESAELQPSEETEPPVKSNTRARRGRTTKKEPTTAAEVEESSDAVAEVEAVVLESSKIKSAAKTRRGRLTKKEMLKTSQFEESCEPTLTVMESDVKSSAAVVVIEPKLPAITEDQSAAETVQANSKPRRGRAAKKETPQAEDTSKPTLDPEVPPEERTRMPVVKSRRGRSANPGALINQGAADESNVEPPAVEPEPKPEAPAVRSGRGAGNKQVKPQVEDAANGPSTETSAAAAVAEEPAVKNVRGGRRTKQPKAQVLDYSQDSETIQQLEAPAARSSRGKRTAAVKDEPDALVKRGRRRATVEAPPVVKPSRGRKAATKSEPEEVSEGSTSVVGPIEETSNETKVPGSATEETPLSEADSEAAAKRGRGRIAKKAKVSTKDTSVREAEEAAAEEEPQQKMSRKKDEPAAKDDAETKQSVHPSFKGRKGRGAKEQEEPEKEKPAAEESIQPVRRGRAAASVGLEVAARQKRGQKRRDLEVEGDKIPDTESLPKRKRGKGAGAEAQTDAAAAPGRGRRTAAKEAEETSVVEAEEAPKNEEKPVRGRRKAAPEGVPPQAEDPISERTTRRGTRGEKKAETDVASAPARRTRRK